MGTESLYEHKREAGRLNVYHKKDGLVGYTCVQHRKLWVAFDHNGTRLGEGTKKDCVAMVKKVHNRKAGS